MESGADGLDVLNISPLLAPGTPAGLPLGRLMMGNTGLAGSCNSSRWLCTSAQLWVLRQKIFSPSFKALWVDSSGAHRSSDAVKRTPSSDF